MAGQSNDCNPDRPAIWLCHQINRNLSQAPAWMTADEGETLARLEGPRRQEYLTSRWLIRQALARASGEAPASCNPVPGRPVASASPQGWHLSLSHSQGLTACATGRSALGIDLEPSQRRADWARVTTRWFTAVEQEWLLRADDPFSFLKVWTLKEAWLKATGRGIAGNLQTLEVRKNFELYGDQPDRHWQASCLYAEGFLVTLVYPCDGSPDNTSLWPEITLLEPPPDDYNQEPAPSLDLTWEPLFHRLIRARP
ncbi:MULTISPECIES: 4'-phosphopantetheinyl transferase family protein [Marinobacter]|uniref:4'-phosphopantetheinyl transferase n=1 Tax=Marinobacter nauticus TaxID=2743 RepID=A0A833JWE6_MARNT|nr:MULTISPECIES: 4'-phosphopantetheinyl transferase superfamily protein [Marinobacter]KAE8547405.1 4'-phosphopantetheinyl transferase [Marinobacter nauticus]MAP32540.1 4'-phosphopantetheinyl transferase [Marinobacter sp.]